MKKAWKDVEVGDFIETKSGSRWEIVGNDKSKRKGFRVVKLKGPGGVFPKTVESSAKAKVVEPDVTMQVRRHGMEPIDTPRRSPFAGLISERTGDPWQVDPLDIATTRVEARKDAMKGGGGPWDKPGSKGEKHLKGIGAELVGIQTSAGAPYSTPPVDPSTIKGHLFLMHEVEAESLSFDELVVIHDRDHHRADTEKGFTLPVPHHHAAERPS